LNACAASIRAATAAIFPSAIATSRMPLMPFFASMTWPPLRRRS
jgi:hypothetical protein